MRKRIFLRKQYILFLSALLFLGFNNTGLGQTVTTDKLDYAPGETVMITGTGFLPGETILLEIEHIEPNMPVPFHSHIPWETIADSEGNFTSTWYVDTPELNTTLLLTAIGQTSMLNAETIFTDATSTQIIGLTPVSGICGSTIVVSATLQQKSQGNIYIALPDKIITFTLGANTITATTNTAGVASASIVVPAGANTLAANFVGSGGSGTSSCIHEY